MDTIETERSHIILHELEAGWWILAVSQSASTDRSLLKFPVNQFDNSARHG